MIYTRYLEVIFFFLLFRDTPAAYGGSQARAYTTVTATQDLSHVCDLHHSSWQCRILIPLSEARDRTWNLMVPGQIHFHCARTGTLKSNLNTVQWLKFKLNTHIHTPRHHHQCHFLFRISNIGIWPHIVTFCFIFVYSISPTTYPCPIVDYYIYSWQYPSLNIYLCEQISTSFRLACLLLHLSCIW